MERDEDAIAYALELAARPNVTVGVISNTNEAHVRWMDVNLPELDQFAVVMKSSEVLMAKPDPVLYRLTLELLDVQPESALFVDDVQANVDGATAVGMAAILHTRWETTRPLLEEWLCR
jgi:HAD superfamily hydrolase (TIGR01509 family)